MPGDYIRKYAVIHAYIHIYIYICIYINIFSYVLYTYTYREIEREYVLVVQTLHVGLGPYTQSN